MAAPTTPVLYGLALGGTAWKPMVPASFANVLYVDNVYGNDTTAQRGCAALPFATIQAALNAMQTDDVVEIAAQTFTITAPLTVPATVIRGACNGTGVGASALINPSSGVITPTKITNSGAFLALWNFATLGIARFSLTQMQLASSGGTLSISADGSAYAQNTYFTGGLYLGDMSCITGGITAKYVVRMGLGNVLTFTVTVISCATVTIAGSLLVALAMSYDATDALATTTQLNVNVTTGASVGTVTFGPGQPQLIVDGQGVLSNDIIGSGLTVSGAKLPRISMQGLTRGSVQLNGAGQELPDTASVLTMDFRGATCVSSVPSGTAYRYKVGGAAVNFQTVRMDSATAQPGCTFTADQGIHLTMRGAVAPQAVYSTPGATGDIVPGINFCGTVDLSAGGTVAKTWSDLSYTLLVRTGVVPDSAFATASAQLSDVAITARNTTGLTFASNVIAGDNACDWQSVWK